MAATLQRDTTEKLTRFRTLFAGMEQSLNGQTERPLHTWRQEALAALEHKPFPTRRDEDWKYTSSMPVIAPDYDLARMEDKPDNTPVTPPTAGLKIVFRNGQLDREHSDLDKLPDGVIFRTMDEAAEHPDEQKHLEALLKPVLAEASNAFELLNLAFGRNGIYLRVSKKAIVPGFLHFIYHNDAGSNPLMVSPQKVIIVEDQAALHFTETFRGAGQYLNNLLNRIHVGAGANVTQYRFQEEATESFQINNTSVIQERDSHYLNFNLDLGGSLVRNNVYAEMRGTGITTNLYGSFLGTDRQHLDTQTFVDHAHPHCQSNELYKGILTDRARGVFNGKVIVRQDAQKTNAFQQNSNLVLSPTAVMDTKPQLEIFADDVRCSHGATVGQLDEKSVFYLRSRGIHDEEARRLLQFGFLLEVVESMDSDDLQNHATSLVERKFAEMKG